jgi:hypothetical protein
MVKLQREKRLGVREQFELEHEDASVNFTGEERRNSEDEMYYATQFPKGDKRLTAKWVTMRAARRGFENKKVVSTFGTVKRFAPEPGSVLSKS